MRVLLLAGEGPYFKNSAYLDGTLFDRRAMDALECKFARAGLDGLRLDRLTYEGDGGAVPLLRSKRGLVPHLAAFTLEAILRRAAADYELFRLEQVWDGVDEPASADFDAVFLSTTFICERRTLRRVLNWIDDRLGDAKVVLGGQYSNLKHAAIMREHPAVDFVVRGDGEEAIPALLRVLEGRAEPSEVPNLVFRDGDGTPRLTAHAYIDLESYPSPSFPGSAAVVPYESMRGCPFSCKFCSFPFASPQWRYKSATKIAADWARYAADNAAEHIRAMDSTFTIPPSRLRELLIRLPEIGIGWEAYARANNIKTAQQVEALASAGCRKLSIGFESMSDTTLQLMDKRVSARENRRAFELLRDSPVAYRVSFMVGYPGERPEDFEETRRFLVDEFAGPFMLSVFSLQDETMPVWGDAQRHGLEVLDPDDPDYAWTHDGMDVDTARELLHQTLDEVRLESEDATVLLWQTEYKTPLVANLPEHVNRRVEKLIDRLGMVPRDHPSPADAATAARSLLDELVAFGIGMKPDRRGIRGLNDRLAGASR